MLFIVLGVICSVYVRRKLEDDYFAFATFASMLLLVLGIVLGLFAPIFYGNQDIVYSANLLPISYKDNYLTVQNKTYYFKPDNDDIIWENGALSTNLSDTEIRIANSYLNQIHYCVEYPRHDIWIISFELLPVPRHYYEFCISRDAYVSDGSARA